MDITRMRCKETHYYEPKSRGNEEAAVAIEKRPISTRETVPMPSKRLRNAGEVFYTHVLYPAGMTNPANACYVNSILQCLFNHPSFDVIFKPLFKEHAFLCSQQCCSSCTGKKCFTNLYVNTLICTKIKLYSLSAQLCSVAAIRAVYSN